MMSKVKSVLSGLPASQLLDAASRGDMPQVRRLLDDGLDVNSRDEDGCTAFHMALAKGFTDIAQFLIARGADPHARDFQGVTALHWAVLSNSPEAMGLGFEEMMGPDPRDATGRAPLSWAVRHDVPVAFEWLMKCAPDLEIADKDGWRALHYAAASENDCYVRRLLTAGARQDVVSSRGETPRVVAERLGRLTALLLRVDV